MDRFSGLENLLSLHEDVLEAGVIAKWAVPEHYAFVEEFPRTSVRKIDKKVLRSRYGASPDD